jgi:hypothetical protein
MAPTAAPPVIFVVSVYWKSAKQGVVRENSSTLTRMYAIALFISPPGGIAAIIAGDAGTIWACWFQRLAVYATAIENPGLLRCAVPPQPGHNGLKSHSRRRVGTAFVGAARYLPRWDNGDGLRATSRRPEPFLRWEMEPARAVSEISLATKLFLQYGFRSFTTWSKANGVPLPLLKAKK